MHKTHYVIIGNSAAALSAIKAIRNIDSIGPITLIAAEDCFAYSPVLLTYYIAGKISRNDLFLCDENFYRKTGVDLKLGIRAERIDPDEQSVILSDDTAVSYDKLLIATGSSPKQLNIVNEHLPGVFSLKTLNDAENILSYRSAKNDIVIIGGGLIGLQAANALVASGKSITLIIGSNQPLSQNVDADCSALITSTLQDSGMTVLFETSASRISQSGARLLITLNTGNPLETDAIIIGKGVSPNTQLVQNSNMDLNQGILVDDRMQTNIPNVYAAGDVAEGKNLATGEKQILATWPNACLQGKTAGINMAGGQMTSTGVNGNVCSILGKSVASVGITKSDSVEFFATAHSDPATGLYRKLVFNRNNEIVGAVLLEAVADIGILRNMINKSVVVPENHRKNMARAPIAYGDYYQQCVKPSFELG